MLFVVLQIVPAMNFSGTHTKYSVSETEPANSKVPMKPVCVKHVFIIHSVGPEKNRPQWNISLFKVEEKEVIPYSETSTYCMQQRSAFLIKNSKCQKISNLICLLELQSHWQISESYPIYLHILRRPGSDLTTSEFTSYNSDLAYLKKKLRK